jgi:hypothetical protein
MTQDMNDANDENGERTYTRREWLTRHALLSGATPGMAREAVASTAIEHPEWDMDGERKTMTGWDIGELGEGTS